LVKCSLVEELDSLIGQKIELLQRWNRPAKMKSTGKDEIDHKKQE
jgi:hypothetical protein